MTSHPHEAGFLSVLGASFGFDPSEAGGLAAFFASAGFFSLAGAGFVVAGLVSGVGFFSFPLTGSDFFSSFFGASGFLESAFFYIFFAAGAADSGFFVSGFEVAFGGSVVSFFSGSFTSTSSVRLLCSLSKLAASIT